MLSNAVGRKEQMAGVASGNRHPEMPYDLAERPRLRLVGVAWFHGRWLLENLQEFVLKDLLGKVGAIVIGDLLTWVDEARIVVDLA